MGCGKGKRKKKNKGSGRTIEEYGPSAEKCDPVVYNIAQRCLFAHTCRYKRKRPNYYQWWPLEKAAGLEYIIYLYKLQAFSTFSTISYIFLLYSYIFYYFYYKLFLLFPFVTIFGQGPTLLLLLLFYKVSIGIAVKLPNLEERICRYQRKLFSPQGLDMGQWFQQAQPGQHHSAQWLKCASELPLTI